VAAVPSELSLTPLIIIIIREAVHNDFQSSWPTTMKTDEHVEKVWQLVFTDQ
jgi:hypothetical protein